MKKLSAKSYRPRATEGFTLIELMVSIAIFVIITSVIVISQSQFGGTIMVTNLAYDVALSVRQAQVYGMSVKQAPSVCTAGGVTSNFQCSYGVHFDANSKDHYVLFADLNNNGKYDGLDDGVACAGSECLDVYRITRGNYISKLCVNNSCGAVSSLDIVFHRPNPEPTVTTNNGVVSGVASITVSSPRGVPTKTVLVSSAAGEISVQ